jgi:hypothetical protein
MNEFKEEHSKFDDLLEDSDTVKKYSVHLIA